MRATIRRIVPAPLRKAVHFIRGTVASPAIDDAMLARYRFADDGSPTPRLTLALPDITHEGLFGGTRTGFDIFFQIARLLREKGTLDLRVILTDPTASSDPGFIRQQAERHGAGEVEILLLASQHAEVALRQREMLVTYNWWVTLNMRALRNAQSVHFGAPHQPLIYLIQDYEPNFYPFSSAHLLARDAYDGTDRLWGIINSSNLRDYFIRLGHQCEKTFVFEPAISGALRPYLAQVGSSIRKPQMLVYGRPGFLRNCFPALVRGLRRWAADYPEFSGWEVLSAGVAHKPIELGGGHRLHPLGKLSLDDYALTLLESSVGVSLMASPHPSYPPLEMAHFGMQVVTNGFADKDLSGFHPNIHSVNSIGEEALASAIAKACRTSTEGRPQPPPNPAYVREDEFVFTHDIADAIAAEWALRG